MQRADELEKLRKASVPCSKTNTPHGAAVEQYAAYATTQMHLIPEEHWFKFTVENMNMIQSFITRRQFRVSTAEVQAANYVQAFNHDASQAQLMGLPLQQPTCTPRQPTPTQFSTSPGCVSTACCQQQSQSGQYGQSFMSPLLPIMPSTTTAATVSPSSFLNVQTTMFPQMSSQSIQSGSSCGAPMAATQMTSRQKTHSAIEVVSSAESSNGDVMSFTDQLFN